MGVIRRLTGRCESVEGLEALIQPEGHPFAYGVLLPSHLAQQLLGVVAVEGPPVLTLHTIEQYEAQGQSTSLTPRLIGFTSPTEQKFFELLTKVRGLGHRKALKAMARPPAWIAGAIQRRDVKALTELPEIGKRLAETIVTDLHGKVELFLDASEASAGVGRGSGVEAFAPEPTGPAEAAVAALVALGETRGDAERLVARAVRVSGDAELDADALVAAAYALR